VLVAAFLTLALLQGSPAVMPPSFDSKTISKAAWHEDLNALTRELKAHDANLAWQASGRSAVNLPALR